MEPHAVGGDAIGYFADRADAYARWRPGYPAAALEAALAGLPTPTRAVDVGCGTGISTRALHAAGARTLGVEPDPRMLAQAAAQGGPRYVVGRAEALPLADASQDLVFVAQAFHWFDRDRALREFQRVLRPGGRVALVWNLRRTDTPFMAAYAAVVERAQAHTEQTGRRVSRMRCASPADSPWFRDGQQLSYPNDDALTWEGVVGRIDSASYFPRAGEVREALLAELRAAFDAHAEFGRVTYAQRTELTLALRAG
ncbi:MAG: class I SAM-dependent methyltransferase [Planctomycetes bacterium]|nr:class I SAM-dependent methyltransferase [Planctomycetota bacterium]